MVYQTNARHAVRLEECTRLAGLSLRSISKSSESRFFIRLYGHEWIPCRSMVGWDSGVSVREWVVGWCVRGGGGRGPTRSRQTALKLVVYKPTCAAACSCGILNSFIRSSLEILFIRAAYSFLVLLPRRTAPDSEELGFEGSATAPKRACFLVTARTGTAIMSLESGSEFGVPAPEYGHAGEPK